jgi:hypothetical protein
MNKFEVRQPVGPGITHHSSLIPHRSSFII